ncbi:competence protein CoiA [Massilia sp.]|uniref:competence protein CoiA n=1 Tax=Massilia sp. TaxID=1882437 RepID=UPI00352F59B0
MSDEAINNRTGQRVTAWHLDEVEWNNLKRNYQVGDYVMECCQSPAIPKTSPTGVQFFSHLHDECATAPETIWHSNAKILLQDTIRTLGSPCRTEVTGGQAKRRWKADVYFETADRKIAIEIQRSPQTLSRFLERQSRYGETGVECFWIVQQKQYYTLCKAILRHRIKHEFGGKHDWDHISSCMSSLPLVFLELDPHPFLKGAGFKSSVANWVDALATGRFVYQSNLWTIN